MTDLRTRIEQRITDLRVERDIAAAVGRYEWAQAMADLSGPYMGDAYNHVDAQDPATTIARIDRELAGCVADLALLSEYEDFDYTAFGVSAIPVNLNARYPEGGER